LSNGSDDGFEDRMIETAKILGWITTGDDESDARE